MDGEHCSQKALSHNFFMVSCAAFPCDGDAWRNLDAGFHSFFLLLLFFCFISRIKNSLSDVKVTGKRDGLLVFPDKARLLDGADNPYVPDKKKTCKMHPESIQ